ncbi:hypothetical protein GE061_003824 [Apolygus lucorum]|uniref:Gustatory receptor n=1 Tax=Apolygus lucorum TaxID=248454 RepID=A0A6A4JD75_APOLU|nr:hypothetical protein GE061_003824 [Apolygus lucorum]
MELRSRSVRPQLQRAQEDDEISRVSSGSQLIIQSLREELARTREELRQRQQPANENAGQSSAMPTTHLQPGPSGLSLEEVREGESYAEAFNNELFKLMRENKELCSDSKLFLYVTMRQTVNFTACGFFSLGYPLVTSIIAAATTYLVILLQFSMPTPPKDLWLTSGDTFTESQHFQLVEALEATNRLYGVQTLFNCMQTFIYLLTNAYFISTYEAFEFISEPEHKRAIECHVVFSLVMLYQMAYFCSETANRVTDFNYELSGMVSRDSNLRRNERLKLYVLKSPSVEFNACGFISIGYPLLTSVLAATITYGVLLFQSELG